MPENNYAPSSVSKKRLWAGRIIGGLPAFVLLTSGVNLTLIKSPDVVEAFKKFQYPESLMTTIGILEFVCVVIYFIPRTSVLGAILLTAYLGGAVATHVRIGETMFIVPVVFGIMIWIGLYLREDRLHPLVPLTSAR
jgi:hypothetical protein